MRAPLVVIAQPRILAGWVPAKDRAMLGLEDITSPPAPGSLRRYVLWPFDRAESRGRLRGITVRLEEGKVLVLGFRWAVQGKHGCCGGLPQG
jgi:hypothetical protein